VSISISEGETEDPEAGSNERGSLFVQQQCLSSLSQYFQPGLSTEALFSFEKISYFGTVLFSFVCSKKYYSIID